MSLCTSIYIQSLKIFKSEYFSLFFYTFRWQIYALFLVLLILLKIKYIYTINVLFIIQVSDSKRRYLPNLKFIRNGNDSKVDIPKVINVH